MIEIRRWDNEDVIHTIKGYNIKECLEDGIKKGINFHHASLNYASLNHASLNGALLNHASLNHASLNYASLNGASLNGALLNGASLNDTSLNYASLNYASLNSASLNSALLNGASLNYARYSISTILKIWWGPLSDSLTLELMRHDAEYIGYDAMDTWAAGGTCPYGHQSRDFYFGENRKLWIRGKPKLRGRELFFALCKERGIKISL